MNVPEIISVTTGITDFKASSGWCTLFMKRHDFVLRQNTEIAQRLSREVNDKIISFQRFVIRHREKNKYALACIGNMEKTPMTFDESSNRTVKKVGKNCASENDRT